MIKSILLVGVGGQGTILSGKILTEGLLKAGYDVKMSEIHGMSQRGGSVSTHIRFGEKVYSPVVELGGADILVSFEKLEALRWLEYLNPNGQIIVNDYSIPSLPILIGKADYPEGIEETISEKVEKCVVVDALKIAEELGSTRVMNTVLLGSLIYNLSLEHIDWDSIIKAVVKPKYVELNIRALERGKLAASRLEVR